LTALPQVVVVSPSGRAAFCTTTTSRTSPHQVLMAAPRRFLDAISVALILRQSLAISKTGFTFRGVEFFLRRINFCFPEVPVIGRNCLSRSCSSLAKRSKSYLTTNLKDEAHLSLLFDGGTCSSLGVHVVVVTVVCSSCEFVLPPVIFHTGETVDSVKLTNSVVALLDEFEITLDKVSFVVCDGCRVNRVVCDALKDIQCIEDLIADEELDIHQTFEVTRAF